MLRSKFGDLLPPTPAWLREKVAKGELGRKTGKGFYIWKDGKADKSSAPSAATPPTRRRSTGPSSISTARRIRRASAATR